jgi:transposase
MIQRAKPEIIEMDVETLEGILRRTEQQALEKEDYPTIRAVMQSYFHLTRMIERQSVSMSRLRQMLFGPKSERTSDVLAREEDLAGEQIGTAPAESGGESSAAKPESDQKARPKKKGHGRNGADDYPGAARVRISHESLRAKGACPKCLRGKVYDMEPQSLVRLVGQSPIQGMIYELERLRCNLCGQIYSAQAPADVGEEKYDPTVATMIGLLKYGTGMPFNRLDGLQEDLGIPLPASTQWEIVSEAAPDMQPAYEELIRQAAEGDILHHDDTGVKILQEMTDRAREQALAKADNSHEEEEREPWDDPERTGLFTSGVVATREGQRIALFFTGRKHAGENLMELLRRRAKNLPPPIQMCDGSSRNVKSEFETILANCNAHARRKFVDVYSRFSNESRFVLKSFKVVYHNDALAREQELTPAERLAFHQKESAPTMEALHEWLKRQFSEHLVEPNSALGAAINYLLKHWEKLTLFLRVPGVPLDNNICERALKKAILHRKNALFFKTKNGAAVSDLYMSLIHSCELAGANPFDYLTELQRHAAEVAAAPAQWMPWNYRGNLTTP